MISSQCQYQVPIPSAAFFRPLQIPQKSRMAVEPSFAVGMDEAMLIRKLCGIPVVTMRIVELTQRVTQHLHPYMHDFPHKTTSLSKQKVLKVEILV